jgi:hypothetical protein
MVYDEDDDGQIEVAGFGKKLKKIGKKYVKTVKKVGKAAEKLGKAVAPSAAMAAGTMFGGPMLGQAAGGLISNLTNRDTRGATADAMLLAAQSGLGSLAGGNRDFAAMLGNTLQAGLNSHTATGNVLLEDNNTPQRMLMETQPQANAFTDMFRNWIQDPAKAQNAPATQPRTGNSMLPLVVGGGLLAFLALRK